MARTKTDGAAVLAKNKKAHIKEEGLPPLAYPADRVRFEEARMKVLSESVEAQGIGTLAEKALHKTLKLYIEPNSAKHEIEFFGSVADVKNEEGIYEIQTRSYEKLAPKLEKLLDKSKVTVVCPLAHEKSVRWIDRESGAISTPHKSPKKENIYDAFKALFGIRSVIRNENLRVRVIYLRVEDFRYLCDWDKSRKRGSVRMERMPLGAIYELDLKEPRDYALFIPEVLGEEFVASEFCSAIKRTPRFSYYVLKFLVACGALSESGKRGRAVLYKRVPLF